MSDIKHVVIKEEDIEMSVPPSSKRVSLDGRARSLSTTERLRGIENVVEDYAEESPVEFVQNTRLRSMTFSPWVPDNAPTIGIHQLIFIKFYFNKNYY